MGSVNNARNFNAFDDFDDEEEYETPVAQRPRANVPPMFGPQYMGRPGNLMRAPGTQAGPAPRQFSVPQPLPSYPQPRQVTSRPLPAPRQDTRALRAPSMQTRSQAKPGFLPNINLNVGTAKLALMVAGAIAGLLVIYFLVSNVLHWWQTWQDDMTYGRPRTVQTDQFVGHSEDGGTPSHFIVQNNNRQITVIEYPGGDVTKTRVIPGPRLFGKDMELAPVKPTFQDVNGDGHVDMVLSVDNEQFIYINENSNFRPITPEERNRFNKLNGGNK